MRRLLLTFVALYITLGGIAAQEFDKFFEYRTMRVDYTRGGDCSGETLLFNRTLCEGEWAGNRKNLVDTLEYGNHLFKVIDKQSGCVIYSRGYCSLFNEWQHTEEALKTSKAYLESVTFPYPKNNVIVEFYSRDGKNIFQKTYQIEIDPKSYQIVVQGHRDDYEIFDIEINGPSDKCVDIVLLGEGYGTSELEKFKKDCQFFAESLFAYSPFSDRRKEFNIRSVWCGDGFDSGVSIPGDNVWKNTPLGAKFYTFDSERYQMVDNFQRVRDYASPAPYDYVYILSNTSKYGGGGIYNMYAITSTDHTLTKQIHVHEFGHQLLGLGDEYVGGADELYDLSVEPWEENLTTLTDFKSKMWSEMVDPSTEIPTPANKSNEGTIGVYEGGGYVSKGVYRPWVNCMMNNLKASEGFCPVCAKAINNYIDFMTDK